MRRLVHTAAAFTAFSLAVGATALTAGCGGNDSVSPQAQFPGTYSLRTVNGQTLPFVLGGDATGVEELTSDVYTFNSDGTFSEQVASRFTPAGSGTPVTDSETYTGTWRLSGTTLAVTESGSDGANFTAVFSGGNTITASAGGYTAVFQK